MSLIFRAIPEYNIDEVFDSWKKGYGHITMNFGEYCDHVKQIGYRII
jgi:hypothetical protein